MAREELLEAQATEVESDEEVPAAGEVRPLPAQRSPAEMTVWRDEVRAAALAAAGGLIAGAATMVLARATRSAPRGMLVRRPGRRRGKIVASRSFVVDVHMLGER